MPADVSFLADTSRRSIAKRTSTDDEHKPSFWRMMEDVLVIV
jgi:hypothetical protein